MKFFAKITVISLATLLLATAALAQSYGKGVRMDAVTPVADILTQPDAFVGRTVATEGIVVAVCARRGCWVDLAGEQPGQTLRIKVRDGEIYFPLEVRGKKVRVQGTVEKITLTHEQALARAQHHAEEFNVPFDPSKIQGDQTTYRIFADGAEVL